MLCNDCCMKVAILVLMAVTIKAQSPNPLSDDVRRAYTAVRNNILRSAEKMPAENYDFRPAPRVRTFAQLIGHIAQEQYLFFCGPVKGEQRAADIERTKEMIENAVRAFVERKDLKLGAVAQPLRAALTGRPTSPGIFDVLHVLGKPESLARLGDQASCAG